MELEQKYLDSREVAEMVEKDHSKLLRDIRTYCEQLNESKIGLVDFFMESEYKDSKGETRPCYNITKKGCEFIGNKLTGVKGTKFTALYINRFHEMEDVIKKPMTALEQISLTQQAVLEVNEKVESIDKDLQTFKRDMPLLAVECDTVTKAKRKKIFDLTGGKYSSAYRDSSLRSRIYRDLESQLLREFGVGSYKAIKRSDVEKALGVIANYQLPMCLAEEVRCINAQIEMEI